ncbi:hypothetical protein ACFQKF_07315 [Halalkalicoccus sp. GCM10025322]
MALPTNPTTWSQSASLPSRPFGRSDDVELYEEDEAFVLSIEIEGRSASGSAVERPFFVFIATA